MLKQRLTLRAEICRGDMQCAPPRALNTGAAESEIAV